MKRCSTSLFLREMQSKTTVYHCIIIKMARINKIISVGENVDSLEHSTLIVDMQKWCSHIGKQSSSCC